VYDADANDAIEALEAKVGINSSAVTTSHDYKLGEVTGTDKAVGKTATQTLTNKTLTSPIINLSSNATGDIYYRASDGTLARLPIGSTGNILDVSAGGLPEWTANPSGTDASASTKGITKLSVAPTSATNPIAVGDNDPRLSTVSQILGIKTDSTGTTDGFCFVSNNAGTVFFMAQKDSGLSTNWNIYRLVKDTTTNVLYITHSTTLSTSNTQIGMAVAGNYLYFSGWINPNNVLRRYDVADLANVTSMTFSGTSAVGPMMSDGTYLYIQSTTTDYYKYSISGTTATNSATITYTGNTVGSNVTCDGTYAWFTDVLNSASALTIKKYAIGGGAVISTTNSMVLNNNAFPNPVNGGIFINSTVLGIAFCYNTYTDTTKVGVLAKIDYITRP
jgi:hypothetical protein